MKYESVLISGSANTINQGLVWLQLNDNTQDEGVLLYAMNNCISVVDCNQSKVICTLRLKTPQEKVSVITTLTDMVNQKIYLLVGSELGTFSLWSCDISNLTQWEILCSLQDMKTSISSIASLQLNNILLFTICDSTGICRTYTYSLDIKTLSTLDTINFHPQQLPLCVNYSCLNKSTLMLSLGGVDAKVHIYLADLTNLDSTKKFFHLSGTLSGHEEWVTCLASKSISSNVTFLASGSQDSKIRLWKIVQQQPTDISKLVEEATNEIKEAEELDLEDIDDGAEDIDEDGKPEEVHLSEEDVSTNANEARLHMIGPDGFVYLVFLEALLIGHEDWVTCVNWLPSSSPLQLFTTSMDRNMVVWSPDESAGGVWMPTMRVGDIGGALGGSIGGNLLGFVNGTVSPNGNSLIGIGYGGSFHYWKKDITSEVNRWFPVPFLSGHFGSVNDIAWERSAGAYLVSVSADQTCRIFAPITKSIDNKNIITDNWKEVSRPQIHGYDLNCLVISHDSFVIYTGSEEKLIRGFDAPNAVIRGLKELCNIELTYSSTSRVEQAYIPELGLSNKGKELMSNQEIKDQEARGVAAIDWKDIPLESQLADYTLWLEIKKLYGHNNEVVCMNLSPCGRYLVSSCKARYSHSCFMIVWAIETSEILCHLPGHESTVVCLEFSPNGQFIASSGKDRSICIYQKTLQGSSSEKFTFEPILCLKNAQKRIIWDLSWSENGEYLATGSRDGTCKIWKFTPAATLESSANIECIHSFSPFEGSNAITAVEFGPETSQGDSWYILVGGESGDVQVWSLAKATGEASFSLAVPNQYCHGHNVKRMRWRPKVSDELLEFASCGEDQSVRIHRVQLS